MVGNNQYQGVTYFSNAFFYILSGAIPAFAFIFVRASQRIPAQSGLGFSDLTTHSFKI